MKAWPVQDAKAKFSELLESCLLEGPQVVTKRGTEAAVLVSIDEWKRLQKRRMPTIKEWLLDPDAPRDLEIPPRQPIRLRPPPDFD